jgi:isochorismate hydrolase
MAEVIAMTHPSGINQAIVDKIVARRGRLHAYPTIDPKRTALIGIDLDDHTVRRMIDEPGVSAVLKHINGLSRSIREHGGTVVWVTTPIVHTSDNFRAIFGEKTAATKVKERRAKSWPSALKWKCNPMISW